MPPLFVYVPALPPESYRGAPVLPRAPPSPMYDANLVKDNYLRSNMDEEGWVPISLIAGFRPERERRLRKKEKKKAGDGSINGEEPASSESSNEATTKKIETLVKENAKKKTQKPPAHFFSKQLKPKPIPPPLINKNKKRWQMWGNVVLAVVAVIAVIAFLYVISTGRVLDFRVSKPKGAF